MTWGVYTHANTHGALFTLPTGITPEPPSTSDRCRESSLIVATPAEDFIKKPSSA